MSRYEIRRTRGGRIELKIIEAVDDSDALRLADLMHEGGVTEVWADTHHVGSISRDSPHPILTNARSGRQTRSALIQREPEITQREKFLLAKSIACAIVTIEDRPTRSCVNELRELLTKLTEDGAEAIALIEVAKRTLYRR